MPDRPTRPTPTNPAPGSTAAPRREDGRQQTSEDADALSRVAFDPVVRAKAYRLAVARQEQFDSLVALRREGGVPLAEAIEWAREIFDRP